jgi:hypothetical protein
MTLTCQGDGSWDGPLNPQCKYREFYIELRAARQLDLLGEVLAGVSLVSRKFYAQFAYDVRWTMYTSDIMQMLHTTRDVTFGPLCTYACGQESIQVLPVINCQLVLSLQPTSNISITSNQEWGTFNVSVRLTFDCNFATWAFHRDHQQNASHRPNRRAQGRQLLTWPTARSWTPDMKLPFPNNIRISHDC